LHRLEDLALSMRVTCSQFSARVLISRSGSPAAGRFCSDVGGESGRAEAVQSGSLPVSIKDSCTQVFGESGSVALNVGNSMKGEMCDINSTPLIDVMLVLLVTLIVSLPLMTHAVKLDMPQRNTAPPDNIRPEIIDLEIDFDGTVVRNGTTVPDFPTLENYFRAASTKVPQPELHLRPIAASNTITWPKCSWQRNVTVCSASASSTLQNSQTDEEPIMGGARRNPFYAVVAQVCESPSCSPSCRRTCCRRLTACASRSNNLTEVSQIKASVRNTLAVGQRLSRDTILASSHQIAFHHHSTDTIVSSF
jgi:biopolymer transport protein ExbD